MVALNLQKNATGDTNITGYIKDKHKQKPTNP
jgi:hypothetical protein